MTAGGIGLGTYLTMRDLGRIKTGEDMLDLVRFIRAQIVSFCRPREELFRLYQNERLAASGFLDDLKESGSIAVALGSRRGQADREVVDLMTAFDRELGKSYLEGAVAACDYYTARLEAHLTARRAAQPSQARVWRTVTTAGALLAAILLL